MTTLTFTAADGKYVATLPQSTGDDVVVEIRKAATGALTFKANIGNLTPVPFLTIGVCPTEIIRTVRVPEGVTVTIVSDAQVTEAGYE